MEATTTATGQQQATTARHSAARTTPKLQVLFSFREACALTALNQYTLRAWIQKRWIKPATRSKGGRGNEHLFSGWQTLALAILAGAIQSARAVTSHVGRIAVIRAWESLPDDDSLLLDEDEQDMHTAERAAAIANSALPSGDAELSMETYERLVRVVAAIDLRVRNRL